MAELIDKNNPKFAEVFNFLNDARYNYDFVKYAKGVHNVDYADALLRKSMENLNKAEGIFKGRKQ